MAKKGLSYLLIISVLLSVIAIGITASAQAQAGRVYLEPQNSTVRVGETVDVEIWVNATGFQGGQINLMYDPSVVNITKWVNNSADFELGYWNSMTDGREWILSAANYSETEIPLTGAYKIGTLTVEGISPGTSELGFGDNSSLFDDYGNETEVSWVGGEVTVNPASEGRVYLIPQDSNALSGDSTTVEVWVNATGFQSGQINLTYDSGCANVTDVVLNKTTFPVSGWDHFDGREWITFMAFSPLSGEHLIATLTIEGLCEEDDCTTPLDFIDGSKLFDNHGAEIPVNWINGAFECIIGICGDVTGNGNVDMGDVVLLFNHVTYGESEYPLSNDRVADVTGNGNVDMGDVVLLFNHVTYGADEYPLNC